MSRRGQLQQHEEFVETFLAEVIEDVVAYCGRRLIHREDATDVAADVLLVVWRRRAELPRDREDARRWTFGIAHHALSNHRRGGARRRRLSELIAADLAASTPRPADTDIDLRRALDALAQDDRELILLVAWEGFTIADAGRVIGIRPDAARARYMRARERLRNLLD